MAKLCSLKLNFHSFFSNWWFESSLCISTAIHLQELYDIVIAYQGLVNHQPILIYVMTFSLCVSTLDGPHLISQTAEKSTPSQPVGCGVPARPAPLILWLLSCSHVPRSGSHCHPPASVGWRHVGRSGGSLQSGQSLLHWQAAGASGERWVLSCC